MKILLYASLIALVICAISLVRTAEDVLVSVPVQLDAAVSREAREAREVAVLESTNWRAMLERQAVAARKDAKGESKQWRQATTEELRAMRKEVIHLTDAQLSDLIAKLDEPSAAAVALMDEYRRVPAIVGARLDPWTDCKGNGACWQAQGTAFLGAARVTAGETSRTMRTVRETAPAIAANVDKTTANVERLTRPDSLGMKVIKTIGPLVGGALFGAIK